METFYNILLVIAALIGISFSAIIFFTGKGDAMSGGGGGVRTNFKGKASFDDQMYKIVLTLGGSFMALMLILDVMATRIFRN